MSQQTLISNPFMLMLQPELVIAAMERSERLNQLNRHQCRPLDRQHGHVAAVPSDSIPDVESDSSSDDDEVQ